MTKLRTPTSLHAALFMICDYIGWDIAAETCRSEAGQPLSTSQLRKYTDPDDVREISYQNAIRLDIAYHKKGGLGFPLAEAARAKIMRECDVVENLETGIIEMVGHLAREAGEAIATVLDENKKPREKLKEVADVTRAVISLHSKLEGGK